MIAAAVPPPLYVLRLRLRTLVDRVARACGLTRQDLVSPLKHRVFAVPRFAITWIATNVLGASFVEVAWALGGRDRTSCYHALRRAEHLRQADAGFRALTDAFARDLVR